MPETIDLRRYGKRHWAVHVGGELLAVTVYRKGARAVAARLGAPEVPAARALAG